jgi:hypothetical protein
MIDSTLEAFFASQTGVLAESAGETLISPQIAAGLIRVGASIKALFLLAGKDEPDPFRKRPVTRLSAGKSGKTRDTSGRRMLKLFKERAFQPRKERLQDLINNNRPPTGEYQSIISDINENQLIKQKEHSHQKPGWSALAGASSSPDLPTLSGVANHHNRALPNCGDLLWQFAQA